MKIIALGDIHGQKKWEKIVEKNSDADEIIFLGDYFDSFSVPFSEQYLFSLIHLNVLFFLLLLAD